MNRVFALTLSALLLLSACGKSGSTPPPAAPPAKPQAEEFFPAPSQVGPVQFSHPEFLFGTVQSGDTVHAAFRFKNMKDYSVTISNVIVSCECMQVDFPRRPLAPHEISEIKVNFITTGYHAHMEKILSVMVEGEDIPVTLWLKGDVQ